jgi:hypothetical protein
MPYIKKDRRSIACLFPKNPGELNFALTSMVHDYIRVKKQKYQTYNDIMGALEGAKLELYRRFIAPYEDAKIKENGDVTP